MKQNFVRLSTRAKTVSLRTLALVMGLVMLLSAVGVGSTLSAFALTNDGSGNQAASLSAAADLGTGIADTATQLKPTLPAYANASLRGDKEDLAATGATYYIWKSESGGNSASQYTCLGTSPQTFSATTGRNYYIAVSTSGTDISSGTVWLDGANVSGVSTSTTGTQGFDGKQAVYFAMASADTVKVSYSSGSKIKIEKGTASTGCSTDKKYIVTGNEQLTNTKNWQNSWDGAGTRNQFTYNSAIGKYELKYTNIAANKSASDTFMFRILDVTDGPDTNWGKTKGYNQGSGAISDVSNLLQTKTYNNDNNFKFSLSAKANITIYLDDSKAQTDDDMIEVIVNPAASTVTAGTSTGGTVKVNGATSASNVTYGGTVTLTATAGTDYVFSQWEDNSSLSYANKNAASTTATVTGSTTVNAIFVPKSYMLTRGTGEGYTITAPATASSSKQWGSEITVTANADDMHYIDYLYYKVNNEGDEVKIGDNAASNATTLTRTLSMPKSNVTVYAKVHERASNTITYGYCTGSEGLGYINVGKQHDSETNQIEYSIESGSKVLEGTKVLFGARPIAGKKFVGWYSNQAGTGDPLSTSKDYVPATASGNYYAKFADAPDTPDPLEAGSSELVLLIYSPNNTYLNLWGGYSNSNYNFGSASTTTISGTTYRVVRLNVTSNTAVSCTIYKGNNDWTTESLEFSGMTKGNTYRLYWDGTGKKEGGTKYDYTPTATPDPDKATTTYYPVKLNITNPDKGVAASTYLSNYFCARSSSVNVYAKPSDTTNMKTSIKKVSGSSDTTSVIKWNTAYSSMTMNASASSATATVTFIPKDYYKVNFSAGAGGTVAATAGGTTITSGTPVMEGTSVTITATPNSGYSVSGWTASGDITTTSTSATRTFTVSKETNAKVYFSASKGTSNTNTYFGYGYNNDPYNWTFTSTYVRDGHVFAYIDTIGTNKTFYIGAYSENPDTTEKKYNKMYYFDNTGTVWCSTEFSSYVTNLGRDDDKDYYGKKCSEGKFTVSNAVKALIIDLGPDDGNGKAQTHQGDENHKFAENNYRIIPVFNTDVNKVSVYAKDASYRNNETYDYLPGIADTTITAVPSVVTNVTSHSEFITAVATKGQNITVTTKIGDSYKNNYYVKGFSVNGVTPELYEWRTDGTYTMTYKIPADFDDNYLEITPIYYRKDLSTVKFYIENYDEAFQNTGWGNTLSIYPYYQDTANKNNAFGGYPGQPVINYGGRRFIEIPTSYNNKTIQGVTLSNDYFDIVHRDYCREVDDHLQTYDYDDFYKIYKETSDGKEVNGKDTAADQITFAFKYRTETNNFSDSDNTVSYSTTGKTVHAPYSSFTADQKDSKFKNGWEPLLDYHDRPIDLFGKQLSSADQTKEPLLVVSDDYAITYAGRYATTWTVYRKNGSSYTKIAEIAPSALIVATQARLGTSTYPAVTDATGYPSTNNHKLADYSDEYQTLKAYANTPVQITYESAIRNKDDYEKHWSMTGGSSEVSKRSDGRWFYSYMNEEISANLRIDYTDEYTGETTDWTTDTFKGNTGNVTGATVHFTNKSGDADGPYALEDYHDTADYNGKIYSNFNHYYKFVATEGSGYIFQGWYMERDGISTAVNADDIKKLTGQSQMTSNATFVARYVKNPAGHITINHTLDDGSTGTAITYIGIEKSTDGTNWTWITGNDTNHYERADKFSVNDPDVMSYNSGYTLRVTLKTEVAADTAFDRFSANNDEHSPNYFSSDVDTSGTTSTTSFEVPVDDLFQIVDGFPKQQFDTLTYFSHTTKRPELTINHNIDPTSDSAAEGDTYVKVEVLDASSNVIETYGGSYSKTIDNNVVVSDLAKGDNLTVPSDYFYGGNNGRKLRVTLVTDMLGFTQFDKFSILGENLGNHATETGQSVIISNQNSMRTKMAVITFPIKDLFNGDTPLVTELPYLSRLILPEYKYEIKYTYPSYTDKETAVSYTVKDVFAQEDLNTYMSLTSNDLAFKDDNYKMSFACSKAPYEDNFQKILDWSKATFGDRSYNASTYTLTLQVIAEAEQQKLNVQFNLPYATDKVNGNNYDPVVSDGKIIKTDPNRILSNKQTYGRDWFVISGKRNKDITEGTDPVFVKAPLIIYDENEHQNYYFKYWSVMTEETDNNKSREYTRCYDYEFNLAIFQDCIITPEYDNVSFASRGMVAPSSTYDDYGRFDPDLNRDYYKTEDNGLTITFIENSRNQYNNGDAGKALEERSGAADRLYSDFLLTYNYYDANVNYSKVVLKDDYAGQKKAGMVIQPVAYMEKTADGKGRIVQTDEYYSTTTKYQGATAEQIKSYIQTGNLPSGMLGGQKLQDSRFDVSSLDNKNRIQYFYGMDNAVAKKSTDTKDADDILRVGADYNNKYLVYKAFAYIGDVTEGNTLTNVVVSSRPVYFTVYTDATIQPGYYMPKTSGN